MHLAQYASRISRRRSIWGEVMDGPRRNGVRPRASRRGTKVIMPATFPDSLACSFQSLGFDIRQCPEATLSELCKLSREERRILVIRDEMLSMSEVRPEKAHGIIALGTGVQTAEGFAQFVRPHLRKAAEAYFQDHITLIRGASAGAAEVVRFRHVNQGVQEKSRFPTGAAKSSCTTRHTVRPSCRPTGSCSGDSPGP